MTEHEPLLAEAAADSLSSPAEASLERGGRRVRQPTGRSTSPAEAGRSTRLRSGVDTSTTVSLLRTQAVQGRLGLFTLALTIAALAVMGRNYLLSAQTVVLEVNGKTWRTRTHQQTVEAFLREIGLDLQPEDTVLPSVDSLLAGHEAVFVQKALPVLIEADGEIVERHTHSHQVADLLQEAGLNAKPQDAVLLDGEPVDLDAALPQYKWLPSRWPLLRELWSRPLGNPAFPAVAPSGRDGRRVRQPAGRSTSSWHRLKLQRAVPLSVHDGGVQLSVYTLARTIGEALLGQGIVLYLGDQVQPMLGTLLTNGMHVEIQRAKPVTIAVDGKVIKTRVQARSVAQLLNEARIELLEKDYTVPALDAAVISDMAVSVVRVVETWIWESEDIPFEIRWRGDSTLELDQYHTDQPGQLGIRKRRVRLVYEDGQETERVVADEWVERQPTTRLMSHGTQIVVRELETPSGVVRYWRKIRMSATSYNAPTAGKPLDHPVYGITRLGWRARKGIVAVDPRVIALGTQVYVPGYGLGTAADTGGAIKGRRIDLCYDDDNLVLWKKWVDVYLLEPVPPSNAIIWLMPSYPREGR